MSLFLLAKMNDWEGYEQGCQSSLESVWRRIASKAYLEASVAMAKGLEKSGRWRTKHDRKSFFSKSNNCWQAEVQSQRLSFLEEGADNGGSWR